MENQLAVLISLYEEEKMRLHALIKGCLESFEGPDYLLAHHHQKALYSVVNTISTLNRFEDSNYDNKERYRRLIAIYEKDVETTAHDYMKEFFSQMLQAYKKELEELNSLVSPSTSESNAGLLETALADLVFKKIRKFRIIFNRSEGVLLELSCKGRAIRIVSSTIEEGDMRDSELALLQKIGFKLTSKNRLMFEFENMGDSSLIKLRFLLRKFVFDIAYFKHPVKENYIQF